ncbi:hypothetical protein RHGRI_022377 [Rhododendron griersonianum]|uniref:Uncharacterized protein n=1 Tax=Rhododendron griersonianum TaxID=479676 RepID=A0AAV6J4Y3_9ERIC|nr:hypothetical protein RHGRI_022377 [Rhododendron griersonianum]
MKTTSPLLYFLSLIIFVFSTFTTNPTKFLIAADSAPNLVLDVEGNELRKGIDYYVLPVIRGNSGGLTLPSTSNATTACPLDVVQELHEVDNGLPLTFSPVNPKKGLIRVSTDTNIKFSVAIVCVRSTVWRLDGYDESVGKSFVTAGGIEGDPGRETVSNWFRIDEYEGDYKLVFCPMVCNVCKVRCGDIGVYIDVHGTRRLALSEVPLKIMFKKA